MITGIAGSELAPTEIEIKRDRRELVDRGGVNNGRAHRIVRLTDGKIFEYARQAALEISGTDVGMSEAMA
jgi:hypothetical protein